MSIVRLPVAGAFRVLARGTRNEMWEVVIPGSANEREVHLPVDQISWFVASNATPVCGAFNMTVNGRLLARLEEKTHDQLKQRTLLLGSENQGWLVDLAPDGVSRAISVAKAAQLAAAMKLMQG
jgi:hypothetical protein